MTVYATSHPMSFNECPQKTDSYFNVYIAYVYFLIIKNVLMNSPNVSHKTVIESIWRNCLLGFIQEFLIS